VVVIPVVHCRKDACLMTLLFAGDEEPDRMVLMNNNDWHLGPRETFCGRQCSNE
jgi:hypothetical protein